MGLVPQRGAGALPLLEGVRANRRHFAFQVEHGGGQARVRPSPGLFEANAHQVATHQRDDAWRMRRKRRVRLGRPRADVREEGADFEQPDVRTAAQLWASLVAALPLAGARDRVRDEREPGEIVLLFD